VTLARLVLWRHGETDYNATQRMQGQLDIGLNDTGLAQARRSAPLVARLEPDVLVSSDLRRAADTAAALTALTGLPAELDKRLRETHVGRWQGLVHSQVEAGWPGGMARWHADPTWAPPGGEARVEVAARAAEVVAELDEGHSRVALLCAHGGLISGLVCRLLGLPVPSWPAIAGLSNCHWVVLRRSGRVARHGWRLGAHNLGPDTDAPDTPPPSVV
jgi:2,3-bisphosphoglycerate-dependent phosphoglycerate mutase/probable phosphoglycerate mutase